jgi:hypothetical protein
MRGKAHGIAANHTSLPGTLPLRGARSGAASHAGTPQRRPRPSAPYRRCTGDARRSGQHARERWQTPIAWRVGTRWLDEQTQRSPSGCVRTLARGDPQPIQPSVTPAMSARLRPNAGARRPAAGRLSERVVSHSTTDGECPDVSVLILEQLCDELLNRSTLVVQFDRRYVVSSGRTRSLTPAHRIR